MSNSTPTEHNKSSGSPLSLFGEGGRGGETNGRGLGGEVPDATNWGRWYWLVLGALAAEIVLFIYLTRAFSA